MNYGYTRKVNSSIIIISIGLVVGVIYPMLSREYNDLSKVLNGVYMGVLGGGFIALNEIWLRRMTLRRMKFTQLIILKSIQYTAFFIVLIILVISIDRSSDEQMSLIEYWNSSAFSDLLFRQDFGIMITYALTTTVVFILFYLISKKMGQGVLFNFILGRYHKAKQRTRIFMYLDLKNSTSIAEKLGDVKYHQFLNKFFYDITDSIVLHYGKIYRYVGDEVIVSWSPKKGLERANYLNTYFSAKNSIDIKKEEYINTYGIIPDFTAAFHIGDVVVGEIGEVKSEITYLGSVTYETTAIEKQCSKANTDILVSTKLLELSQLPDVFSLGEKYTVNVPDLEDLDAQEIIRKG